MYNALNSLGAGGLASPWYANATAAAGYGMSGPSVYHPSTDFCFLSFPIFHMVAFMAFFCIIGGIIVSKIGVRLALLVCTGRFVFY
jgi:hypothetical protein